MINPLKDIDWNEIWAKQMERNRESSPGRDCARIWESRDRALRFWDMCRQERSRIDRAVWEMDLSPQSRVLDIGAGPGTLAIPMAQKAAWVTAVEPAKGMVCVLREKMAEFGTSNINVVQKRWEEVDVQADLQPPYDVVIASFSLGMQDYPSSHREDGAGLLKVRLPVPLRRIDLLGPAVAGALAASSWPGIPFGP